ncbi:MAG: hypothetical protein QGI45_00995 [Myxococcota bacterium]|nr:hypothetical protein [Myxococcota bacterium]
MIVRLSLILGLLTLLFAHFYQIGDLPSGQYHDESSLAYNAYAIAQHGVDEYGRSYPLFFRAFDNYFDPLIIYNLSPWFLIGDLSLPPLRLLNALIFLFASMVFGLICMTLFPQPRWAALGFFIYSLLPWTFPMSRIALGGNNYFLLSLNLGFLFFLLAYQNHSVKNACFSALSFGLGLYAYHIARPFYALFFIALIFCMASHWRKYKKEILCFTGTLLCTSLPLLFSLMDQTTSLTARFSDISLWHHSATTQAFGKNFITGYLSYFDPRFLFMYGDFNLRHHTGFGGQLFLFMAPLLMIGLYRNISSLRTSPTARFVLCGLLLAPLPAALTIDVMHGPRTMHMGTFYILLSLYGAEALFNQIKSKRSIGLLALMLFSFESGLYLKDYFGTHYQKALAPYMHAHINTALKESLKEQKPNEILYISRSVFPFSDSQFKPHIYAHILFHTNISPLDYQKSGFDSLVRPYHVGARPSGLLLRTNLIPDTSSPNVPFKLNTEPLPEHAQRIKRIPIENTTLAYYTSLPTEALKAHLKTIASDGDGFYFELWRMSSH